MQERREGGCLCGAVRFEVRGPALEVCICHCNSCRRATGGAMVAWATYPVAGFGEVAGTLATFASSPGVTRGHCARCGSSLTYQTTRRPQEIDVTLASLGDPVDLVPAFHIWTQDRVGWLQGSEALPQHAQTLP